MSTSNNIDTSASGQPQCNSYAISFRAVKQVSTVLSTVHAKDLISILYYTTAAILSKMSKGVVASRQAVISICVLLILQLAFFDHLPSISSSENLNLVSASIFAERHIISVSFSFEMQDSVHRLLPIYI